MLRNMGRQFSTFLLCTGLLLSAYSAAGCSAQHKYHYDGPEIKQQIEALKAHPIYLPLKAGATLTVKGRLITITGVHQDAAALLIEGTVKNVTAEQMIGQPFELLLNESPDKQMKWFHDHPVTTQYHYGPGFNSHAEAPSSIGGLAPGETRPFVASWTREFAPASGSPEDLVVVPQF